MRRYAGVIYAVIICPSVRQKQVLHRNYWTDRAGFWHGTWELSLTYPKLVVLYGSWALGH